MLDQGHSSSEACWEYFNQPRWAWKNWYPDLKNETVDLSKIIGIHPTKFEELQLYWPEISKSSA